MPTVTLSAAAASALLRAADSAHYVLGVSYGASITVLDVVPADGLQQDLGSTWSTPDLLSLAIPYGVHVVGVAIPASTSDPPTIPQHTARLTPAWLASPDPAGFLLCRVGDGDVAYSMLDGGKVQVATAATSSEGGTDVLQRVPPTCALLRVAGKMDLPVYAAAGADPSKWQQALQAAQARALQGLEEGSCVLLVQPGDGRPRALVSSTSQGNVASLTASGGPCLLDITMLQQDTPPQEPAPAPSVQYQPVASPSVCILVQVELDAVAYTPRDLPLSQLAAQTVLPALRRHLEAAVKVVAAAKKPLQRCIVRPRHFAPPPSNLLLSLPYLHDSPSETTVDDAHQALRRTLHTLLGLPTTRPLLRISNAVSLASTADGADGAGGAVPGTGRQLRLLNVHEALTPPLPGGTVSCVSGRYWYHHYMQDKFNDSGWGCAYRSLQTLCSWFLLQHFTNKPIPTHRTIQETLVQLGDKDASFVGSTNWIGAIELGYVLDSYLGVTSRIITVNQGSDIPSYARQLAQHFQTQGTPVMIGGGVLAYTLLGVQFDEATGECAFLILDPHYTGGEDLKKIHSGTWVGWKRMGDNAAAGGPLFVPSAFYNFLCPQVPDSI